MERRELGHDLAGASKQASAVPLLLLRGETEGPANQRFFLYSNSFNSSRMTKTQVYWLMAVVSGT
jgi:hypothetical protein